MVEGAVVCWCGSADMVIVDLLLKQVAEGRQKGQEGEEHAQEGESVVALGKIEIADSSKRGMNLRAAHRQMHRFRARFLKCLITCRNPGSSRISRRLTSRTRDSVE